MSGQYMSTEQITMEKPCKCLTCGLIGKPDEFAYLGQCIDCDEIDMLEGGEPGLVCRRLDPLRFPRR